MMGNDQDLGFWAGLANQAGCLETVEVGHADVDHDDVGSVLRRLVDRFTARTGFSADGPAGMLFDQHTKPLANQIMVISD